MGSDIYDKYPVAKQVLDDAEDILQFNLKKLMFQGPQTNLNLTSNAQPGLLNLM